MKLKTFEKILIGIFTFFLIIITVWLTVVPITKAKSFYMYEYEKNDTSEVTGYSKEELEQITEQIIAYLFNKADSMQVEIDGQVVFSNQALIHMRDVRTLYTGGQIIAWIIFGLWLGIGIYFIFNFKRIRPYLFKYSMIVLGIILVVLLIIGIVAIIDFDYAFVLFHKVLFPDEQKFNDAFFSSISNYDELPGVDNTMLVKILSIGLFMDVGIIIGVSVVVVLLIWFIICFILRKKYYQKLRA
jgi:integral membrane protein (TIGR01906 family)